MANTKRAGAKSLAQNDYLGPHEPTAISASDVGTNRPYNDGSAVVSFTAASTGPAATSFVVYASTGQSATGSSSPITLTGIPIGTVVFSVKAVNSAGESTLKSTSGVSITTVPSPPTSVSASSPGNNYDSVSWAAPSNNGGKAISNYYITSSDGKTANTTATSINISQEGGTSQTYTVYADNANGRSSASSASGSVTTFSFTPFSFFGFTPFSFTPFSFFGFFGFSPFSFFGGPTVHY